MSWLLYVMCLGVGGLVGFLYARRVPADDRIKELELHLTSLQAKYEHYQERVTENFSSTAQIVNALTQQYRQLHDHLRQGADTLCSDTRRHGQDNPSRAFLPLGPAAMTSLHDPVDPAYLASVAPPRDYADKAPHDKGMLDDEFGLK